MPTPETFSIHRWLAEYAISSKLNLEHSYADAMLAALSINVPQSFSSADFLLCYAASLQPNMSIAKLKLAIDYSPGCTVHQLSLPALRTELNEYLVYRNGKIRCCTGQKLSSAIDGICLSKSLANSTKEVTPW